MSIKAGVRYCKGAFLLPDVPFKRQLNLEMELKKNTFLSLDHSHNNGSQGKTGSMCSLQCVCVGLWTKVLHICEEPLIQARISRQGHVHQSPPRGSGHDSFVCIFAQQQPNLPAHTQRSVRFGREHNLGKIVNVFKCYSICFYKYYACLFTLKKKKNRMPVLHYI